MTPLDLDAIEARCDAATRGPWKVDLDVFDKQGQELRDATFIAAARTDVPALLALVRELEAEKAASDNQFICLECGTGVKGDEDGCCTGCGRDCLIIEDGVMRNADAVRDSMSGECDAEVRTSLAEYAAKVDAAIEKGKTNLGCHWCGETADITDQPAIDRHYRTCAKSPLVIEIAALKSEASRMLAVVEAASALVDKNKLHRDGGTNPLLRASDASMYGERLVVAVAAYRAGDGND